MNWRKLIKEYNEWLLFPIALSLFFIAPKVYMVFDPTAGRFDAGIFHSAIYSIAILFLFSGVSWFIIKVKFPVLKQYLDDMAENNLIKGLSKQQQSAIVAFCFYLAMIFAQILILFTL